MILISGIGNAKGKVGFATFMLVTAAQKDADAESFWISPCILWLYVNASDPYGS